MFGILNTESGSFPMDDTFIVHNDIHGYVKGLFVIVGSIILRFHCIYFSVQFFFYYTMGEMLF